MYTDRRQSIIPFTFTNRYLVERVYNIGIVFILLNIRDKLLPILEFGHHLF